MAICKVNYGCPYLPNIQLAEEYLSYFGNELFEVVSACLAGIPLPQEIENYSFVIRLSCYTYLSG